MERFFKSIEFIEQNIYNKISVHDVAAASHYSTYHFSRVFKSITGESIKDYIRKRRLTIAAKRLLEEDTGIMDLALDAQFASQEAFTRAFKKMFGISPGQYRLRRDPYRLIYCDQFSWSNLRHLEENVDRQPRFVVRQAMKVVGIAKQFSEDDQEYLYLWAPFKPYMGNIPNEIPGTYFGLYEAYDDSTDEVKFTYMCCACVSSFDDIPEGMEARELPEQLYAVFQHRGMLLNVHETFKYIWGTWLPNSDYDYHPTPEFELYNQGYDSQCENSVLDLYIPVVAKQKPVSIAQ